MDEVLVDRSTSDAVTRARDLLDLGASPASIAAALNHEQYARPDGKRWHASSVLRMLGAAGAPRPVAAAVSMVSAEGGVGGELAETQVVLHAVRELLRVESAEHAVGVLIETVSLLGGGTVPAHSAGADALPIDLSLGQSEPLLPVAPAGSTVTRTLSRLLPSLVEDARLAVDHSRHRGRLAIEADTDPLTGLGNRRKLRGVRPLLPRDSVVMLDLDHFKAVNDTHGHAVGDQVLIGFSRLLRTHLRASDLVFRLGGEEFLVVMGGTTPGDALETLGKLKRLWRADRPLDVTFSAGVASVTDGDLPLALARADAALYRAKEMGRDRFEVAAEPDDTHDVRD